MDTSSEKDVHEMRALIKGRVQGVGFRATTRYYALELGLKGTVRNLPDGSVEIYAQGSKPKLEELIQKLKYAFGLSAVEETTIEYVPIGSYHHDFRILH